MSHPPSELEAIAIIGMSGRFPGARNLDEFWRNLEAGVESITTLSDADLLAAGVDRRHLAAPELVKASGFLDDVDLFDAAFFGYSPREAETLDPQHRLFLECAWEAMESAGYAPDVGRRPVGVFGGVGMSGYLLQLLGNPDYLAALGEGSTLLLHGNDKDHLTTRVSYKLNLSGPSLDVQTACSTSLVAVHLACQHLLAFQCDLALAGGVSIMCPQRTGYWYRPGGIVSPDGHCRAFDAQAQGTVFGSGVGVVTLKRLGEALADGDPIRAVILGSAINNDGAGKVGYTAPSYQGQAEVIALAHAVAGVDPGTISYVEAHGTGTSVGDPIEIEALAEVFRRKTAARECCALGSVKTNVGHLNAAAGVAGLIKTVLALERGRIPASLHYHQPNPKIDFARSPFFVNRELRAWPRRQAPRRAAVSSFGIGGTNAHLVLEEAPAPAVEPSPPGPHLFVLSARDAAGVGRAAIRLADHLDQHRAQELADVAWTLQTGRKAFPHRATIVGRTRESLAEGLRRGDYEAIEAPERPPDVVFLFGGQGSQYVGMGRTLYARAPRFRALVDECAARLRSQCGWDLRAVLQFSPDAAMADSHIHRTEYAQPALFVLEYALARLWESWGIRAAAMLGHSLGEYVAACLAEVFSLDDALSLVAARGRLMQALPVGAMAALAVSPDELVPWLAGTGLSLAAINAPTWCVVSGPHEAIAAVEQRAAAEGRAWRRLVTSHAFHSAMMDPALDPFREVLRQVKLHAPRRRYASNLTGQWIAPEQAQDPEYWVRHLRQTVRFGDGVRTCLESGYRLFLEVGSGRALGQLVRAQVASADLVHTFGSLPPAAEAGSEETGMLQTLGSLWQRGLKVDWVGRHDGGGRRRVPLPTYPFDRQRYWIERGSPGTRQAPPPRKADLADWVYAPSWKQQPLPQRAPGTERLRWLVFADEVHGSEGWLPRLRSVGEVICVRAGKSFEPTGEAGFTLDPKVAEDYSRLVCCLAAAGRLPDRVVYAWTAEGERHDAPGAGFEPASFFHLLHLAQALAKEAPGHSLAWTIMTRNLHAVTGAECLSPWSAAILGPVRVIPAEFAGMKCSNVDLATEADGVPDAGSIAGFVEEMLAATGESVVAYRHGRRWTRSIEPVRWERPGSAAPLRSRGVYWITGGLGGMGLALAEHLAEAVQARLVLTSRSGLPDRSVWSDWLAQHGDADSTSQKILQVRALEDKGSEVWVAHAEVADADQMSAVVQQIRERYGVLHGVIHAAGLPGAGLIALKTPEAAHRVLSPKVNGLLVLHQVLRGMPLDFLVLCSSVNALIGGAGQVDYCAANAFLDAYAHWDRATQGRHTIALNWDTWQEVGMAVHTPVPESMRAQRQASLQQGLRPHEGRELFARVLASPLAQLVISPRDFAVLMESSYRPQQREAEASGPAPVTPPRHRRPNLRVSYVAPRDERERTIAILWEGLLGLEPVGVDDNFLELGGHSLLGVQLTSRLRQAFGVELPLTAVFEYPTVATMAKAVAARQADALDPETLARLVADIRQLPADEVEARLAAESTEGANA
jgi:acyl transferase domain-containing protein/acyl carrier protein